MMPGTWRRGLPLACCTDSPFVCFEDGIKVHSSIDVCWVVTAQAISCGHEVHSTSILAKAVNLQQQREALA